MILSSGNLSLEAGRILLEYHPIEEEIQSLYNRGIELVSDPSYFALEHCGDGEGGRMKDFSRFSTDCSPTEDYLVSKLATARRDTGDCPNTGDYSEVKFASVRKETGDYSCP